MSNNENGIKSFLNSKNSIFSPTKANNRRRSRSKSRDSRDFNKRTINQNVVEHYREDPTIKNNPVFTGYNPNPTDNFQRNYNINTPVTNVSNARPNFETPVRQINPDPEVASVRFGEDNLSQASQNTLWTGILSHSTSFESARVESNQCLENLSLNIRREISTINSKIDLFNSRMTTVLNNEFRGIKEKILQVFEAAFKESDKYIQEYMKQKQAQLAGDLTKMKSTLEIQLKKIDNMKQELGKSQWRKVAGQILSTELEHHVQEIIKKSSAMEVGKWQLGDITGYRIKNIEAEIKEVVRLKA